MRRSREDVTVRIELLVSILASMTLAGCEGCDPGRPLEVSYPPPLEGPPRPHEGPTSRRWSGPCWRDVATPAERGGERVWASTSFEYDAEGFVTHLEHNARVQDGISTIDKKLQRGDGGAFVDEHRKLGGGSVDIRYHFATSADGEPARLAAPVPLEPREDPMLCLCPTDDRGICYLGEQVFCRSLRGTIDTGVGDVGVSCIACGDDIRVHKVGTHRRAPFASKMSFRKIDGGMEVQTSLQRMGEEPMRYWIDAEARRVRQTRSSSRDPKREMASEHPDLRSLKESCALESQRCIFDDHENLLEVQRLGDDGGVEQREVMSYACREATRVR